MKEVAAIARLDPAAGMRDKLLGTLAKLVFANIETEPGTRRYILHEEPGTPTLWMYELYDSQADLDAHMGADWFAELGSALGPLLAGPPKLTFLKPVRGKGI